MAKKNLIVHCLIMFIVLIAFVCSCQSQSHQSNQGGTDSNSKTFHPEAGLQYSGLNNLIDSGGESNILPIAVRNSTLLDACFVDGFNGKQILFTVSLGKPAHLLGFDVKTQKVVYDLEIKSLESAWSVVSVDGILYIAGANGHLYSFSQDDDSSVKDIGRPFPGNTSLFCLTFTKDGTLYGGGYPNCQLFKYNRKSGFSILTTGPLVKNEKYIRSIQYNEKENSLFLGIGAHAHLLKYFLDTKKAMEILPQKFFDYTFVYDLKLLNSVLFSRVTKDGKNKFINFRLGGAQESIDEVSDLSVKSLVWFEQGNCYIGIHNGNVGRFKDPTLKDFDKVSSTRITSVIYAFVKNGHYFALTNKGELFVTDLTQNKTQKMKMGVKAQALRIRSLSVTPQGKIFTSGLIGGGIALFDPNSRKNEQLANIGQIESIGYLNNYSLFGVYPYCKLYLYDSNKKWNLSNSNPRLVAEDKSQSRPIAIVGISRLNIFVVGTIPEYGKLGGALLVLNVNDLKLQKYYRVVADQSIISLTESGGFVYGGSSVYGGLGAEPNQTSAKLFKWDPSLRKTIFSKVIFPGSKNIYGVNVNKRGNIVGIADNKVFEYSPKSQSVIKSVEVVKIHSPIRDASGGNLILARNGKLYANVLNNIYEIDSDSFQSKKIMSDVKNLTYDIVNNKLIVVKGNKVVDYRL